MHIKELADKLNISARAIRFYEDKGLISPAKQENNQYRSFEEKDVWRLQTIISLREAGMSIEDIRQALDETEGDDYRALKHYLELQRAVLFAKWLEMKQVIETTDHMIDLLKSGRTLPLEQIYELAEGSKRLREQRSNWRDTWNFDRLASSHDQRVANNDPAYPGYEQALDLTVQWVSPIPGERGLDIGTGTGNLAGKLLARGAAMDGVDQSNEMLKQCRSKFPEMETRLGNFLAIPYLHNRFDFVVSSFAFRHLTHEQQELAIDEMRRVLKPHGRICITDFMLTEDPSPPSEIEGRGEPNTWLENLLGWLEARGYVTKHKRIIERLHIVYAIPIR